MIEVLKAARALIAKGWCQFDWAQNSVGQTVPKSDPRACRYCIMGALMAVAKPEELEPVAKELMFKSPVKGSLTVWNDKGGRTQAEVLDLFDNAIRRLENVC